MVHWLRILRKSFGIAQTRPARKPPKSRTVLRLEELEGRIVPADLTVTNLSGDPNTAGSLPFEVNRAQQGQTIGFQANLTGTIPLGSEIQIAVNNLTIDGVGANITIDGGHSTRLFEILGGNNATINNLTLTNGYSWLNPSGDGGAILVDGNGQLTVNGDTFTNNEAASEAVTGSGGAIENQGILNVDNGTTFSNNTAQANGGAIDNNGELNISGTVFSSNSAGQNGGAIANEAAAIASVSSTFQTATTFASNTAGNNGGAIENYAQLNLNGTQLAPIYFNLNTANTDGGAIDSNAASEGMGGPPFALNAVYTLFYGNEANTGAGGAVNTADYSDFSNDVFASFVSPNGLATPNQAQTRGGAINATGGNLTPSSQVLSVTNSTFANNQVNGNAGLGGAICTAASMNMISLSIFNSNLATAPNDSGGAIAYRYRNVNNPAIPSNAGLWISQSTFHNNVATLNGGAIFISAFLNAGQFQVSVDTTTFSDNVANANNGSGGGVYEDTECVNGTGSASTTFTNDTFYQNVARTGWGGAIELESLVDSQSTGTNTASLTSLTIYDNTAQMGGAGVALGSVDPGAVSFDNNILDDNNLPPGAAGALDIWEDIAGSAKDIGFNLIDPSDATILDDAKDVVNAQPGLIGALADNNAKPGYPQTLAVPAGSPALGAGDPDLAWTLDERGYTRGMTGPVTIGAEDPNAG